MQAILNQLGAGKARARGTLALCVLALLATAAITACHRDNSLSRPGKPDLREGLWTFVILPDTQKYAARYPEIFASQTQWIVEQAEKLDIRFVLHVGDIVDRNSESQWQVASDSLHTLDGHVPYILAPGNHDFEGNARNRNTFLNQYFPSADQHAGAIDAGTFEADRLDNSYRIVDTPSGPWLLIALEFGPRDNVVAWANALLVRYRHVPAAIVTHAYLYGDGTRYNWDRTHHQRDSPYDYKIAKLPGGVNDGQDLWKKLVRKNDNVVFVFSGHVLRDGIDRLTSKRGARGPVHQVVANYQMNSKGGGGYLRIVQVDPVMKTARVSTYSPYLDRTKYDGGNQFTLNLRGTKAAP